MRLTVSAGYYEAPDLLRLLWLVVKHRTEHWLRGEGWSD